MHPLPPEIFKAYDIRGVVGKSLTPPIMGRIGAAIGGAALERGRRAIVVGRDGRLSGPELSTALIQGLRASGVGVTDLGMVTTPMAYFAAHHLDVHCVAMLTGSHNPPQYNGLKIVLDSETLSGEAIQALRRRAEAGDSLQGEGGYLTRDIGEAYIARIASDIRLTRPLHIAVDCGNGVAGAYAPKLFRALGCTVTELFCEVDGHFPHHHPDPSVPANLRDLQASLATSSAEIGLAFDGDGDRLGVVTKAGKIVYPDRQLMLLAADVLSRHAGAEILYDIKSTRRLDGWIRQHGGRPTMWKTGHSLMKAKMRETGALLAGEVSGHIFFQERWYGFDDGLYAGARLLEYLSKQTDLNACLEAIPDSLNTPELHIPMAEGEPHRLVTTLRESARFEGAERVIDIDGLRVEYPDGFGLLRASNTTPDLILRFEADDAVALTRIQSVFRALLTAAAPNLSIPF